MPTESVTTTIDYSIDDEERIRTYRVSASITEDETLADAEDAAFVQLCEAWPGHKVNIIDAQTE